MLTIPKRLRRHARFDRSLLGKFAHCAWTCIQAEVRRLLRRDDVVPGMVAAIQTHGELLHWHPHLPVLLTCGAFTPTGDFLELPQPSEVNLQAGFRCHSCSSSSSSTCGSLGTSSPAGGGLEHVRTDN